MLLVVELMLLGVTCHAQDGVSRFTSVFKDSENGLSWSAALPGRFTNGCWIPKDWNDINECAVKAIGDGSYQIVPELSEAAKACSAIGARLPTEAEFLSLVKKFDHIPVGTTDYGVSLVSLTDQGFAQMNAIFGDMPNWFWSSFVLDPKDPKNGSALQTSKNYAFPGSVGTVARQYDIAVRCVQ